MKPKTSKNPESVVRDFMTFAFLPAISKSQRGLSIDKNSYIFMMLTGLH
jgi:hypothetical protein